MAINTRTQLIKALKENARDDLCAAYLENLDKKPGLYKGVPLAVEEINALCAQNKFAETKAIQLENKFPRRSIQLQEAFKQRHSAKGFKKEAIQKTELAELLYTCFGPVGRLTKGGKKRRPYPSGGGLYPVQVFVIIQNIKGLHPGAYHYAADTHQLHILKNDSVDLKNFLFNPAQKSLKSMVENANGAIILGSNLVEAYSKYGHRAWKLALLEAGHMGQNLYLAGAAMGKLGICAIGGYANPALPKYLGLNDFGEKVLYSLLFGRI